jgi:hypothetical protein
MRPLARFLLLAPACLTAQAPFLDDGRLDVAWFGQEIAFKKTRLIEFLWIKPGLVLEGRTLRLRAWDPAAWLAGPRAHKDRALVRMLESTMATDLEKGLRKGLREVIRVSATEGDLALVGRVVDANGDSEDYMSSGAASLTVDVKLLDVASGELVGAFHDTVRGQGNSAARASFAGWCEDLGRTLREASKPVGTATAPPLVPSTSTAVPAPPALKPAAPGAPVNPPAPGPAYDLDAALRRLEALRKDGLLTEDEYQTLRKKALDKAR